jgi:hypothetical protein
MRERRLSELSEAEFEALIEGHIERMAHGDREIEADVFIDLLLTRGAARETHASGGRPIRTARGRIPDRTRSYRRTRRSR